MERPASSPARRWNYLYPQPTPGTKPRGLDEIHAQRLLPCFHPSFHSMQERRFQDATDDSLFLSSPRRLREPRSVHMLYLYGRDASTPFPCKPRWACRVSLPTLHDRLLISRVNIEAASRAAQGTPCEAISAGTSFPAAAAALAAASAAANIEASSCPLPAFPPDLSTRRPMTKQRLTLPRNALRWCCA